MNHLSSTIGTLWQPKANPHGDTARGVILSGNPGIGKSVFLTYFAWALAAEHQTVYFESEDLECGWLLRLDGSVLEYAFKAMPSDVRSDTDLVYLFDASKETRGGPSTKVAGFTVLSTSPKRQHYSNFRDAVHENRMYMPVWTEDEVISFSELINQPPTHAAVISWHARFGGIPRYLFTSPESYAIPLENAISTTTFDKIQLSLGGLDSLEDVSHMLLHYDVDSSFKSVCMRFASKYVEDAVVAQLFKSRKADTLNFVFNDSVGKSAVAGVRGSLFERFAHERLARGGSFRVRPLTRGGDFVQWNCPALQSMKPFAQVEKLDVQLMTYVTPTAKNFAALDSFGQFDAAFIVGFQMTVSSSHAVKSAHLCDVLNKLGYADKPKSGARKFRIVFVVPPDIFDDFTCVQSFLGADGQVLKNVPAIVTANCEQFVLELAMS